MTRTALRPLSGELEVWQSNSLVEASHTMTLNERRLIYAAAALHDPRRPVPASGSVKFHADEFGDVFGLELTSKGRYHDLAEAAERLFNRRIESIHNSNGRVVRHMRWVWLAEYNAGEATVTLGFSPPVLPYLTMLSKEFTRFKLKHIGNIGSQYGLRLYEICAQWRVAGRFALTLQELRDRFALADKYSSVKDLQRWVLTPSLREVNTHTDFRVTMTTERRGRKIIGFKFEIKRDTQIPLDLPMPEEEEEEERLAGGG